MNICKYTNKRIGGSAYPYTHKEIMARRKLTQSNRHRINKIQRKVVILGVAVSLIVLVILIPSI